MGIKDPIKRLAYDREWRKRSKVNIANSARSYRLRRRLAVLQHLGGKCVRCGADDYRVLHLDHINGGGGKERKTRAGWGFNLETAILTNTRTDIQILCANCHAIKTWHE